MNTKALLIIILVNLNLSAQTYTLDNSFGDSGIKRFGQVFQPKKGLFVNDTYYFISPTSIAKVNYNGQLNNSFGIDGIKSLQQTGENLTLFNFTFTNNYFFLYGFIKNNTSNNEDIFVCKIDENGNYDTSFGANGRLRLDFSFNERISDLTILPSGTLYCTGTRLDQSGIQVSLLLFKINNNGTVDTTFDSNGYKEINPNILSSGGAIIPNAGNYFLLGTTKVNNLYDSTRIMLTKVDENGNIITSYGTNGFTLIPIPHGASYSSIYEAQLLDDKFYVNLNLYTSHNHDALFDFDATTGESLFFIDSVHKYYQKADNDGIYMTDYYPGSDILNNNNSFNLSKLSPDGIPDTTFNNTGIFSYEFDFSAPLANDGDSQSMVFIKEPNGKFLIAGFAYDAFISNYSDFAAIRIVDSSLGLNTTQADNKITMYPNPFDTKVFLKSKAIIKSIEIYDLIGRKIAEPPFQYEFATTTIDLSKITEKGNYIIKITTNNGEIVSEKLIKN
jgi:uncharacterized delta-60 repeat protein